MYNSPNIIVSVGVVTRDGGYARVWRVGGRARAVECKGDTGFGRVSSPC